MKNDALLREMYEKISKKYKVIKKEWREYVINTLKDLPYNEFVKYMSTMEIPILDNFTIILSQQESPISNGPIVEFSLPPFYMYDEEDEGGKEREREFGGN